MSKPFNPNDLRSPVPNSAELDYPYADIVHFYDRAYGPANEVMGSVAVGSVMKNIETESLEA